MKPLLLFAISFVLALSFVSATSVGYNNRNLPQIQSAPILSCNSICVGNSSFNESATNALYIRRDGTSVTTDMIPFFFGLRIPQADNYFLFGDTSQGPGNLFYSAGVENFGFGAIHGVILRNEPNAFDLSSSAWIVLTSNVSIRASNNSNDNGTVNLFSDTLVSGGLNATGNITAGTLCLVSDGAKAGFAQCGHANNTDYALAQTPNGHVHINAPISQEIGIHFGGSPLHTIRFNVTDTDFENNVNINNSLTVAQTSNATIFNENGKRVCLADGTNCIPYSTLNFTGVFFTKTADTTIRNGASPTDMLQSGVGGLTIPVNNLTIGKTLRIDIRGIYSSNGTAPSPVNISIGMNNLTGYNLLVNTTMTPNKAVTNGTFQFSSLITIRSTGKNGQAMQSGYLNLYNLNTIQVVGLALRTPATVDTTQQEYLNVTLGYNINAVNDVMVVQEGTVEVLN